MRYQLIAAVCEGGGIGYKGGLPWSAPADMRAFSKITKGNGRNAIIMGRATWLSLPRRPLPGRCNIVLSSRNTSFEGAETASSVAEIDKLCAGGRFDQVWIIGGAQTYRVFLEQDKIDVCVISRIHRRFECDVHMPRISGRWIARYKAVLCDGPLRVELHQSVRAGQTISPQALALPDDLGDTEGDKLEMD